MPKGYIPDPTEEDGFEGAYCVGSPSGEIKGLPKAPLREIAKWIEENNIVLKPGEKFPIEKFYESQK